MTGHIAEDLIAMLVKALAGRRAIIDGGRSEKQLEAVPDTIYLMDGAPHEWLFPQMRALVHHGGSGTTAEGLRAGKPTLVIPHFFDQFYFGRRIRELGAGPEPISRHAIDADSLNSALDKLLGEASFQRRADEICQQIQQEQSANNITDSVKSFLSL